MDIESYKKCHRSSKKDNVIHAKWECFNQPSGTRVIRCSHCKEHNIRQAPYCPNCGVKMDLVVMHGKQ